MVLIDTNVLAYFLIEGDRTAAAQELKRRDPDWRSESFVMIEFSNVLGSSIALRALRLTVAQELLAIATNVMANKLARVSHSDALATAAHFKTTAYDARFLALARQTGLRLVTEDRQLRAAAPGLTQSIEQALARV